MGLILDIDVARAHLELDADFSAAKLGPYIDAAEQALADFLGRPLLGPGGWPSEDAVPANVLHAVKLILTDLFDDRNTPIQDMTSIANLCGRYIVTSFA